MYPWQTGGRDHGRQNAQCIMGVDVFLSYCGIPTTIKLPVLSTQVAPI